MTQGKYPELLDLARDVVLSQWEEHVRALRELHELRAELDRLSRTLPCYEPPKREEFKNAITED